MSRRATKIKPGQSLGFLPSPADLIRLLGKITVDDKGCWIFTGHTDRQGYGQIRIGRAVYWAHRVAFSVFRNDAKIDGKEINHTCRCRACCNPEHLEPMTRGQNGADANRARAAKKRTCEVPF